MILSALALSARRFAEPPCRPILEGWTLFSNGGLLGNASAEGASHPSLHSNPIPQRSEGTLGGNAQPTGICKEVRKHVAGQQLGRAYGVGQHQTGLFRLSAEFHGGPLPPPQ